MVKFNNTFKKDKALYYWLSNLVTERSRNKDFYRHLPTANNDLQGHQQRNNDNVGGNADNAPVPRVTFHESEKVQIHLVVTNWTNRPIE